MAEVTERLIDAEADQLLVERVQKGDSKAFDILLIKYQHRIANVIYGYVKDYEEARDLTQDTFIKVYRSLVDKSLAEFKGDSSFYSWLYRIAVNTVKNYITAKNIRPPQQDIDYYEAHSNDSAGHLKEIENPEHWVNSHQLYDVVQQTIDDMPVELSKTLNYRENDDLDYVQIAKKLSIPVGTVRSRLSRARKLLIEAIKPYLK